jgi:hypothetical protein
MNVLLESESKEAIKKNLLKNSANLALIYGFSELYLQIASRMCQPQLHELLSKFDAKKYAGEFKCNGANDENLKIKLVDLKKYKLAVNDDSISFSAFFIDIAFEVLRNNKEVTETLGFLTNPFPLDKDFYIERSAYFKVQAELGKEVEEFRKRLTEEVDILLSNYILIRKLYQSDKNLDALISDYKKEINAIVTSTNKNLLPRDSIDRNNSTVLVPNLFNALVEKTKSIYEDLQQISATPQVDATRNTDRSGNTAVVVAADVESRQNLSEEIAKVMAAFSRFVGKDTTFDQNDLYYIESSTKPLLLKLVTERNLNSKYLYIADEFDQLITYKLLKNLKDRLEGSKFKDLSKAKLSTLSDLLELITRLDELDKVETYEYVIKTIQDISEIFPEKKLGMYVKTLVDNLERYTIINQEEKKVEIAVEDIITHIYDKYANRESKIFNLYFSIGVNQSITSNFTYQSLLPDSAGFDVDTLKSVAFVSEKIGFKIKIIDFKWRRSFSVGETYETRLFRQARTVRKFESNKPLVSDIYFVGYASGLLYKVANLTTKEEFNDPIAGIGLGVSFFNSLDLNLGYNWPLRSDNDFFESFEKNGLLTIGFDIKITEYLTALGKKRQKND